MGRPPSDLGALLRELGLRSTPQRRAILRAFRGGVTEHLSADEIHHRASQELPDLGRGTVYATLAEFTEHGLVSAHGTPDPVRYEVNTAPHHHFRCRLCLRLFDLPEMLTTATETLPAGFDLERIDTRATGVCSDCTDYERGLAEGARAIAASGGSPSPLPDGIATVAADGPLGTIVLAATPDGLVRVAFEDHADAGELRARAGRRRGSRAAHQQLERATEALDAYLHGDAHDVGVPVDWSRLPPGRTDSLRATRSIPYGDQRSYTALDSPLSSYELGLTMGANPVPLAAPCHRVTRGTERPLIFVGGVTRRRWLETHESGRPG